MTHHDRTGLGCAASLVGLLGLVLLIAGGIGIYPSVRTVLEPLPDKFGEDAPPLGPLVTPSSGVQLQSIPLLLPETPLNPPLPPTPAVHVDHAPAEPLSRVPQRLIIPAIDLDAPIEAVGWHVIGGVSMWDVPNHYAAGWLSLSALPGALGNIVLDGHHNTAGEVFRRLVELKRGDEIEVRSNGKALVYRVTSRQILAERDQSDEIRRRNAQWIQPTADERLTLVTCWPYTSNTHRLIIVAKPVRDPQPDH